MWRTPAAAAAPSAVRPARVPDIFSATATRRRRLLHLAEEAGQVAREVVERAAGGHDVDEAEQRRLELGVLRGELHRLGVRGLQAGGGTGAGGRPRGASPPRAARARGSRSPPCRRVYGARPRLRNVRELGLAERRRPAPRRGGHGGGLPRAHARGARGAGGRAGARRRRLPRRHRGAPRRARGRRRAGEGRDAVAQLRPPGGAERRPRPRARRRRGDDGRRPPGPAGGDPRDARRLAPRRGRRLRGARVARGGDALQAGHRALVLPRVRAAGAHRPRPRRRATSA